MYSVIYYLILCQNNTRWQTDTGHKLNSLLLLYCFGELNDVRTYWFCSIGNNRNVGEFRHIYILLPEKINQDQTSGNIIKFNFHNNGWYWLRREFSELGRNSFHFQASRLQIALCVPRFSIIQWSILEIVSSFELSSIFIEWNTIPSFQIRFLSSFFFFSELNINKCYISYRVGSFKSFSIVPMKKKKNAFLFMNTKKNIVSNSPVNHMIDQFLINIYSSSLKSCC